MRQNIKKWLLLLMISAFTIAGCGFTPSFNSTESESLGGEVDQLTPTDDSLIVVGVSQVGSESVWRTANTNSIQETFTTDQGYFLIFNNARQKQENQIKAIREFISQEVDYILLSPITEDGWDTVLQEAKDAGIPVILFDRRLNVEDESLYVTCVGSDFYGEGKKAADWLSNYLQAEKRENDNINIVVLQGTKDSTSEVGRTKGFDDVVLTHKNWNILEEVDAEYTTTKGKEVMKQLLKRHSDINVVVAQNDDMMFGALEAIEEAGLTTGPDGDIILISFDACQIALQKILDRKLSVDVECNPLQGGYLGDIIQSLERGEEVQKEIYVEETVFDLGNTQNSIGQRTY